MDLAQLEVFLAVAREGRFSRAAEKLYRTQSAVSQTIRKLEDELGEPLFDRSSREGLLTDAGRVLHEYAEKLLHSIVIYLDELAFVVPPAHPLASAKQVSISQLGAESFVAHTVPSPYREKVIQTFRRHKTPLHMDVELPTLQAIKSYIVMGNGVALVPEIAVEGELARGELVRIPVRELQLDRKLRLIYRKQASWSHAAQPFLTF